MITDTNVGPLYAGPVTASLTEAGFESVPITVPAGERSKSLTQVGEVCDRMTAGGLDRSSFVVALGGGVVGDLAGFAAAIFFRGIPYVQVPTSVVAQVDSAVGGKTGINISAGKNLLGSFHQPVLVLADVGVLTSLPEREFNEGFAEIIKHGIIRDRTLLDELASLNRDHLESVVARNVRIKAKVVAEDETEQSGTRALLNFGHTIGHAIENAAGYGVYLHGEAISLGIIAACAISRRKAGLPETDMEKVIELLRAFSLPTRLKGSVTTEDIEAAMRTDKKFRQGDIRFVLSPSIGEAFVSRDVTSEELHQAIEGLRK